MDDLQAIKDEVNWQLPIIRKTKKETQKCICEYNAKYAEKEEEWNLFNYDWHVQANNSH